jgi:DNA-binding transcriptional MerR regulator
MEKTTGKKLLGGFMVVILVAVVGAVITNAQTDDPSGEKTQQNMFFGKRARWGQPPFFSELTDEQKEEIEALRETLKEENTSAEDIRAAIQEKLEEFGVEIGPPELTDEERDEQLDTAIERTEQQLTILTREKELRENGYSWDEIKDIIQEEFDLEFPAGDGQGMMMGPGFHDGLCRGPRGFMSDTASDI